MKLKSTIHRMLAMCPASWYIFIRSLQLSCFLLFCSFILLLEWNGSMAESYELYMTALALEESVQAVLLSSVILSVCIEDQSS